jgi:hypothetical protein
VASSNRIQPALGQNERSELRYAQSKVPIITLVFHCVFSYTLFFLHYFLIKIVNFREKSIESQERIICVLNILNKHVQVRDYIYT